MRQIVRTFLRNTTWDFLLVKHTWKDYWVLPGWHIEKDEDIYKAIKREIKEELNLSIKILWNKDYLNNENIKEKALPICTYKITINWEKRLEYIFLSEIKSGEIKKQDKEISDYKFFSKNEIITMENTYSHYKEILKHIN